MLSQDIMISLAVNVALSVVGYFITSSLISALGAMFIKANLFGVDMCKSSKNKM